MKLLRLYMSINNSVTRLVSYTQSVVVENADLKQKLADALSNDAADAATIAAAQAEATTAAAKVVELQSLVDADITEDAQLQALIDSVLPAETVEAPVVESTEATA